MSAKRRAAPAEGLTRRETLLGAATPIVLPDALLRGGEAERPHPDLVTYFEDHIAVLRLAAQPWKVTGVVAFDFGTRIGVGIEHPRGEGRHAFTAARAALAPEGRLDRWWRALTGAPRPWVSQHPALLLNAMARAIQAHVRGAGAMSKERNDG